MIRTRPRARAPGGLLLLLGLGLLLPPALVPAEAADQEDQDAICQGYRGTALWGQCTAALATGCAEAASPRCEGLERAWLRQTGAMPPWLLECGFSSKCVFVTSSVHDGNLGGLAGGDAICQARAEADGSLAAPGTYKAWLSDSSNSPAGGRFTQSSVPYRLVDGTPIASRWTDLVDGTLAEPIDLDESENVIVGVLSTVWTGTGVTGTAVGVNCGDWVGGDRPDERVGMIGDNMRRDFGWTAWITDTCDQPRRLYCFQQ